MAAILQPLPFSCSDSPSVWSLKGLKARTPWGCCLCRTAPDSNQAARMAIQVLPHAQAQCETDSQPCQRERGALYTSGRVRAVEAGDDGSGTLSQAQGPAIVPQKRRAVPRKKKATNMRAEQGVVPQGAKAGEPGETYDWPPLVCCVGEAINEFVPSVRVSKRRMHPHIYSSWKMLQWSPPEFTRAPAGPASNVAIALSRLGGRAAFMGKLGRDAAGQALLFTLNSNGVQTRGVSFVDTAASAVSHCRLVQEDGRVRMEVALPAAQSLFTKSDIHLDVMKEARLLYFSALSLTAEPLATSLLDTMELARKQGADIFLDLNLPLPLWVSQMATLSRIEEVWFKANFVELTIQELEFLLGEEEHEKRRKKKPMYYVKSPEDLKQRRPAYHYEPAEIQPLWHDEMKCIFVTDGTYKIHYYTPTFHGSVAGTEDVLVTPFTCDRTGSGDALVAGIIRKLTTQPEILQDQDKLEKALRFAICAGIIAQWTIGAVRGMPTESAAQNLTEQVYPPSMV